MINRVIMVGRLTRDPELRRTTNGTSVASFTIAVDSLQKDQNGQKTAIFMPVSVFGNGADSTVKFTRKGSLVGVDGRLNQRKYARKADGVQITVTEIIAENVEFLDPKGTQPRTDAAGYQADQSVPEEPAAQPSPVGSGAKKEGSKNLDSIDVVDDDLPF